MVEIRRSFLVLEVVWMNVLEFRTLFNFQLNFQTSFQLSFFFTCKDQLNLRISQLTAVQIFYSAALLFLLSSQNMFLARQHKKQFNIPAN